MKQKEKTYSKHILSVVVGLYFIGAILGTALVVLSAYTDFYNARPISVEPFGAYAAYLGGPTSVGLAFYSWKSKAENVLKIANQHKLSSTVENIVNAISQIN